MEALRAIAARYKLRYLLLYREQVERDVHSNGWAAGYITLLGALFVPGATLTVDGYAEASLFDVKTGILLYTVRQPLNAERRSNVWQRERKLADLQRKLAIAAAEPLAKQARSALVRLQETTGGRERYPERT